MEIKITALADLKQAASALLQFAEEEKVFIFEGDMGAGKTTFIKSICAELGVSTVVTSPTFSIVNEYQGNQQTIYHFDFYRIKSLQEAYDIGYEEYFYSDNICLIEWPEKVAELLPHAYIKVSISAINQSERLLSFTKI